MEQDRLDLQHHIYRLCQGGALFCAPMKEPQSVLDIGTGTGIWAMVFADEFPGALVIGTDLSPIQPGFVPPNLKFYVDNFESPWVFPEVAARHINGSIPTITPKSLHVSLVCLTGTGLQQLIVI